MLIISPTTIADSTLRLLAVADRLQGDRGGALGLELGGTRKGGREYGKRGRGQWEGREGVLERKGALIRKGRD